MSYRVTAVACLAIALTRGPAVYAQADSLDGRVRRAVQQYERGDRQSATQEFTRLAEIYLAGGDRLSSRDLAAAATAYTYLGLETPELFRSALRAYDRAIAKDPGNLEARTRLAELFLDKYNSADAKRTLQQVLARNDEYVPALLAEARRRVFDGERGADSIVGRALALDAENVAARVLRARFLADAEDFTGAKRELDRALKADPTNAPALSFGAALLQVTGDSNTAADLRRRYEAAYPREAGVDVTLAELQGRIRQYASAAAAARAGTQRDPKSWRAHALLGSNLLRLGDVPGARKALETAFKGDPYDVWTKNTLDLLDTFSGYDEISAGNGRFRFMIEKAESGVLSLYLGELAERAYSTFSTKYGYAPPAGTPIRVEVYRSHADFSVRTVGLAGLGALGVSFGNTVAFDSPAATDAGTFIWGSTAWHELAHTFTLGASDQRVPRWLSEGLSVYEERRARPGWGQRVTPGFLTAYAEGRLLPVSRLNDGFIRPTYPRQVIFSYYQASLVCEMIARDFSEKALVDMLREYRNGQSTEQVVRRVLRMDFPTLDKRFEAYMRELFGARLAAMASYEARVDSAKSLAQQGNAPTAIAVLQRARASFPEYGGADGAYPVLATLLARGDKKAAADVLATMVTLGEVTYETHVGLADLLLEIGDTTRATAALEAAMWVNPFGVRDHERLAQLYARTGDKAKTIRERRAVVALRPVDRAEALYQLAVAYRDAGDTANARHAVIQSLEEAPHFERAQDLLLALHESGGVKP
ncbi:MAG TPA: tetratricopeptide repeat protein [Gemmatimonadaceae bacterium]|nr:tetratricopeptide repeat protein [Gemmatimonadaceae bacterium]